MFGNVNKIGRGQLEALPVPPLTDEAEDLFAEWFERDNLGQLGELDAYVASEVYGLPSRVHAEVLRKLESWGSTPAAVDRFNQ